MIRKKTIMSFGETPKEYWSNMLLMFSNMIVPFIVDGLWIFHVPFRCDTSRALHHRPDPESECPRMGTQLKLKPSAWTAAGQCCLWGVWVCHNSTTPAATCRSISASSEVTTPSPLTSAHQSHSPRTASHDAIAASEGVMLPSWLISPRSPILTCNRSLMLLPAMPVTISVIVWLPVPKEVSNELPALPCFVWNLLNESCYLVNNI